jgi:hypothetical protein
VLSVWHCAHALVVPTDDSWFVLSVLMALGIDYGLVASEVASILAHHTAVLAALALQSFLDSHGQPCPLTRAVRDSLAMLASFVEGHVEPSELSDTRLEDFVRACLDGAFVTAAR